MKTTYLFLSGLVFFCFLVAFAQAQKQSPPEGATPRDFQLPAKKISKLSNGLTTTMIQYGAIPKVTISIIIKTGNIHEGPNEVWLGNLTGNLMREGTTTMDFATIAKKVAAMGGEVSIITDPNHMTISGSVLSEFAPDFVKILADIVVNPKFPANQVDRLKNDLKRQLATQKVVSQNQAQEKFRAMIYKDHAYGRYFPTEEMLNSYTLEMAKGFYDKNVGAKRTVVYVVGKFEEEAVKKSVEEAFEKWKEGPEVNYPIAQPVKAKEVVMIDRKDASQTTVVIGLPTLDPSRADYLTLQVTNSLLGGTFGSRITANIREDKGYSYTPRSTINIGYRAAIWYEQADVTTEHTGASLQEISKEIKRLQTEAPSADELKGIQNYEAGIFVLQNSTPAGIINQLNQLDFHGLPDAYLNDRVKNIYQITPEKIQQVAKDYYKYEDMTLVLVGDQKQIDTQIREYQKSLKAK